MKKYKVNIVLSIIGSIGLSIGFILSIIKQHYALAILYTVVNIGNFLILKRIYNENSRPN